MPVSLRKCSAPRQCFSRFSFLVSNSRDRVETESGKTGGRYHKHFPTAVVLSAAKDLTKLLNDFEHCEVSRRVRGSG